MDDKSAAPNESARPGDPRAGQVIGGKYRLVRKLSAGTMGDLYLAETLRPDKPVALKLFYTEFSRNAPFADGLRQLMVGVRGASKNASQIVGIHDCDIGEDGSLFVAMELIRGRCLADVLRRAKPLGIEHAVRLADKMADALGAAHDFGIVHGDVCPTNFIVTETAVRVVGFERARLRDLAPACFLQEIQAAEQAEYRSPEQIKGQEPTALSDVYGLGIVFYEMLTGRVPFSAPTANAVKTMQLYEAPRRLRDLRPEIPEMIEAKVLQALEKDPARRQNHIQDVANEYLYDSAMYYEAACRAQAEDERVRLSQSGPIEDSQEPAAPPHARWRRWATATAMLVAVAGGASWYFGRPWVPESVQTTPAEAPVPPLPPALPVLSPAPGDAEASPQPPSDAKASAQEPASPAPTPAVASAAEAHGTPSAVQTHKSRTMPARRARRSQPAPPSGVRPDPASTPRPAGVGDSTDPGAVIDWLLNKAHGPE